MTDSMINAVRWFNHRCPWHQPKPSISRRVEHRLALDRGPQIYDGVAGRFRMRLDLANDFERQIYLNNSNVVMLGILRRVLRPGDRFVDAGASVGLMMLVAAGCVGTEGRVFAFEPQPAALERLRENVQLNDLQQVSVIPRGVWDEPTTTTLYEFDENRLDLPSMGDWSDSAVARRIEVETTRIDDAVEGPIRMMKVDVEGAEYRALQGAERTIFESGPAHLILELCPEAAHSFGYEAIELADWVLEREPNYRMYWIKSRRCIPIDREGICAVLERDPGKYRNIWFRPPG